MTPQIPAIIQNLEVDYPGFTLALAAELAHNTTARKSAEDLAFSFLDKAPANADMYCYLVEEHLTPTTAAKRSEIARKLWGDLASTLEDSEVIALHMLADVALTPGLHAAILYYFNLED